MSNPKKDNIKKILKKKQEKRNNQNYIVDANAQKLEKLSKKALFDIVEDKERENKKTHDKIINKKVNEFEKIKNKSKYNNMDKCMVDTIIGEKYRNFVSSEYGELEPKLQRKYHEKYHEMDNKLYDLDIKLNNKDKIADNHLKVALNKIKKYDDMDF